MLHGADIYKYARIAGCKPEELIDFSSNINLYQPKTEQTLRDEIIVRYADSSYMELKNSIANNYNLKKEEIALYNGATAAIFAL